MSKFSNLVCTILPLKIKLKFLMRRWTCIKNFCSIVGKHIIFNFQGGNHQRKKNRNNNWSVMTVDTDTPLKIHENFAWAAGGD